MPSVAAPVPAAFLYPAKWFHSTERRFAVLWYPRALFAKLLRACRGSCATDKLLQDRTPLIGDDAPACRIEIGDVHDVATNQCGTAPMHRVHPRDRGRPAGAKNKLSLPLAQFGWRIEVSGRDDLFERRQATGRRRRCEADRDNAQRCVARPPPNTSQRAISAKARRRCLGSMQ